MFEVGAADFKKSELLFRAFRHETLHILVIVFLWNFRKVKTGVPATKATREQLHRDQDGFRHRSHHRPGRNRV